MRARLGGTVRRLASGPTKLFRVASTKIIHVTDIEGNDEKLDNIIKLTSEISRSSAGLRFADSSTQFVFGGDAGDRGPGTLKIMSDLTKFKEAEPDRVTLIVGNREAKMTRIKDELLDCTSVRRRLLHGPGAHWAAQHPPSIALLQDMQKKGVQTSAEGYLSSLSDLQCQAIYLRWMLTHTMGCGPIKPNGPDTMELLRAELSGRNAVKPESFVSDEDIVQILIKEVSLGGVYDKYLSSGSLMYRFDDTLFIHGAVNELNLGHVPGRDKPIELVDDWMAALNEWFHSEVASWRKGRAISADEPPGSSALMKYMVHNPRSVVTTNWYSNGKLRPLSDKVISYLKQSGISRVVSGHQPFSDFPLIIRNAEVGRYLEVIVNDTSMSDPSYPTNNQGVAHNSCVILFDRTSGKSTLHIEAVRRSGLRQVISPEHPSWSRLGSFTDHGGVVRLNELGHMVSSQLNGYTVIDTTIQ
jgi:hypothetical protein